MHKVIEKTQDYDKFTKNSYNRKINEKHLVKLQAAIKQNNLLACKPVVVDKEYNIIDGQHRIAAAKNLGIPFYFYVDDDVEIKDMKTFNTNNLNWSLDDFLNHHQDKAAYQELSLFLEIENLKLNIGLKLLHGSRNQQFIDDFKMGIYTFPNQEEVNDALNKKKQIQDVISYVKTKTSGPKTYLDKVTFYEAMIEFFNIKSFDYKIFMQKLQYKLDYMHPCNSKGEYKRVFVEIYNFKNQQPILIDKS